ncbi:THUMP-like domain-containing protein [Croceiramulus getboli]|nr:class I SAM-dependent methyltransferase [Flavobacteriaceae bacterium YJPT1-3]
MSHPLLNKEIQDFIRAHEKEDILRLLLNSNPFPEIDQKFLIEQIHGRQKAKEKLPTWYNIAHILYPPKLNLEQTSSEITANYKASLTQHQKIADLTGGFGVDAYAFAKANLEVHYFELNPELATLVRHNFAVMGIDHVTITAGDGLEHLLNSEELYDVLYIDPSRRDAQRQKVFLLGDCIPNVPEHLDALLTKTGRLLVKTSPMLDLQAGLQELNQVHAIHIIAVDQEVKELVWDIRSETMEGTPKIIIALLQEDQSQVIHIGRDELENAEAFYEDPQQYLYEPHAALLKAGAFQWLSQHFKVGKLHVNSHLYTADKEIDFPGRKFEIKAIYPFDKRLRKQLLLDRAHISTRNFPKTVAQLRSQLKWKDGGPDYLFFTRDRDKKLVVLHTQKVNS